MDPTGREAEAEYGEVILENITQDEKYARRMLKLSKAAFKCLIHEIKDEGLVGGNPDVWIDVTNANVYLPKSFDFIGCLIKKEED